jgi:2,4-dienoyl-CoA reductase-like NADH-dependent reductase (Old Yellow Enzyme family)
MQQSPLFQPLSLRQVTLRNRIVMAPMVSNMGITSQQGICWYRERARGGVGLVIVESTWLASFHDPAFVAGLPALARAVHAEGAAIVVQLHQPADIGGEAVAVTGGGSAREVTAAEIERIVADYAHAARVCADAGFDGVEPHGAHGFLLNQFFSPRTNQRRDAYGDGLAGRMRLGLEIVRAIRAAAGDRLLLLYRHTPQEDAAGGYSLADTLQFMPELVHAGVDVLDISPSIGPHGEHAALAAAVKQAVSVPVIAVNGMREVARAEAALREGKCDLVALGRQLIADAHWPTKVRDGRLGEIIACTECSEACFGGLRRGVPIGCVNNPASGKEYLAQA